jgi:ParB/RepB/Spo0J family partition protein
MRKSPAVEAEDYPTLKIPLTMIHIEEQRLRYDLDDDAVIAMANSIAKQGLLQTPGVSPRDDGEYTLIWGGRRLAAHTRLGRTHMLCRIRPTPPDQIKNLALVENLHRKQMTLAEECAAVAYLHLELETPIDEISEQLSHSRDWILKRLAVPQFPEEIREPLLEGSISIGTAETIAALPDEGVRRYVLSQVYQSKMSLSETKALVKAIEQTPGQPNAVDAGLAAMQSPAPNVTVTVDCQVCGAGRTPSDLISLRVCADGCAALQPQAPEENGSANPRE